MTSKASKFILQQMAQKILLVGDSRICPQVAYVMDWQNFEQVERLTDVNQYHDYKIVVCDFKRKKKRYLPLGGGGGVTYLDDLCRTLDQNYSLAAQIKSLKPKTKGKIFLKRVLSNRLVLALLSKLRRRLTWRCTRILTKIPPNLMKPSELFLRVIYASPSYMICDSAEYTLRVASDGNIGCCTTGIMPLFFGNILDDEPTTVNATLIRIIKLSFLNGSHCFCNLRKCPTIRQDSPNALLARQWRMLQGIPNELNVAVDPSCNLACPSCRQQHIMTSEEHQKSVTRALTKILSLVNGFEQLTIASQGEVWYSPLYQTFLTADHKIKQVFIISNGTLFNAANWEKIAGRYEQIDVSISVDAATPATYQKLRGADFEQLLKNLDFLAALHKNKLIRRLRIMFVVQRDNYREMKEFVKLGKRLQVDNVGFIKLNNWGTFTKSEYRQKSLLRKNGCLQRDFYNYLQDPIFKDPIVMMDSFAEYLTASAKRYGEYNETPGRGNR